MIWNNEKEFGFVAKFFHWLIAFAIIGLLSVGYFMQGKTIVNFHQLTGLTVLSFAVPRLIWKMINQSPKLPNNLLKIEKIAAKSVQALLYLCMFIMPISGWMMSTAYGLIPHIGSLYFPCPGVENNQVFANNVEVVHNTVSFILLGLIVMHIGGALKHTFIDKDPSVLRSMLPRFKK